MNRLLLADLRRMWRPGLAISFLLGCGVALFVMTNSSALSLQKARRQYYSDYRFGDIFTNLVRAPNQLADRILGIEGIERVQTRIVQTILLDIPQMVEPASCLLVSIDTNDPSPMNAIYLSQGRFPEGHGRSEVIVGEAFAEAHRLHPGDTLDCIMGGREQRLNIVGIGLSPEHVYVVQPGMLVTDDRRYGVIWMPRRQMEAAFNMEGAFNNLSIALQPRVNTAAVIVEVDRQTRRYGGSGAYDRSDQPSHHRVADEMQQQKTMAFVTPSIFLAVSAFLFNIVFTRLVTQQTEQIATLRAFGYRPSEIGWHYVKLVLAWVLLGSALGWIAGLPLSWWMTSMYLRFFRFPTIKYEFAIWEATFAAVSAASVAILATITALRRAVSLQPAVAMRPAAPKEYRNLLAERIGLDKLFSPMGRMIIRRIETNPLSTTLSVLGMSLGIATLVLGSFLHDTINYVVELQFQKAQRQDALLTFVDTLSFSAAHDAAHLPGVTRVEGFRSVAVKMRNGTRSRRLALLGMNAQSTLYRILDAGEQVVSLPRGSGLTISHKLADLLDVDIGGTITVEILDREQRTLELPVTRIFPSYTDLSAYMNRIDLHEILHEGEQLSGVFLSVDSHAMDDLYAKVKQTPWIASVLDKHAAESSFVETISESISLMRIVNAVFSVAIALGVIYNCASIILAERARDLATLRVMGFRRQEVSRVLIGELAFIALLSIPIGIPIGYGLSFLTTLALDTETHRFPLIINRFTYAYATTVLLAAATVSAVYVRRMSASLDLVAVLKVRD